MKPKKTVTLLESLLISLIYSAHKDAGVLLGDNFRQAETSLAPSAPMVSILSMRKASR